MFGRNQSLKCPEDKILERFSSVTIFSVPYLPLFLGSLIGLAFFEEGLWDGLIWKEHFQVFKPFFLLPKIEDSATLTWLVPLLILPQLTHYLLDGFIWRLKERNSNWQTIAFHQ